MTDLYAPTDVTKKYPGPPFDADQQQQAPGSVEGMHPRPDHGETTYRGTGRLTGVRALITGGDSGIGRAVAIAYAREGAAVALNYLPVEQQDADSVASLLRGEGAQVELVPGDLSEEAENVRIVEAAASALGGIDVLVMVGGVMSKPMTIDDFDTDQLDGLLRTNVFSLFWLTKAAKPHMKPGASIIATGSQQGFTPTPTLVEYAISKAAVHNWVRATAQQLADSGIRVNGVAPGPFWTPLQPVADEKDKLESFGGDTTYGRPGQPVEIASTYVYLAEQAASYTSGEIIVVNGGVPLH